MLGYCRSSTSCAASRSSTSCSATTASANQRRVCRRSCRSCRRRIALRCSTTYQIVVIWTEERRFRAEAILLVISNRRISAEVTTSHRATCSKWRNVRSASSSPASAATSNCATKKARKRKVVRNAKVLCQVIKNRLARRRIKRANFRKDSGCRTRQKAIRQARRRIDLGIYDKIRAYASVNWRNYRTSR